MGQDSDKILKLRQDNVVWRQVGDEIMILDTSASEYLSVNATGSALWPLLLEGSSLSDLTTALVDKFGVDETTARTDSSAFIASLQQMKLLEP